VIAPLVRLRSLSEGQNQWLSSSPATAGFPQSLSCSCARPRPTYRPLPSNNPGNLTMLAAMHRASSRVSGCAASDGLAPPGNRRRRAPARCRALPRSPWDSDVVGLVVHYVAWLNNQGNVFVGIMRAQRIEQTKSDVRLSGRTISTVSLQLNRG
jgi:hypothetical protein